MATMVDSLKQALDRASHLSAEEQEVLATVINEAIEADTMWEALLADPLTPQLLDELAKESIAEDDAGRSEEIKGDGFLS